MGKADIELLFGVAGGGSVSGASGAKIQNQLNNIIGHINKNPLEVEIAPSKGSVKNFQRELSNLTAFAQSEAKQIQAAYEAAVDTIKISTSRGGNNNNSFQNNAASTLNKDTKEYYKAASELSRLQMAVRENLRNWTKARDGASSDEYKNLERQAQRLETLNKVLERGKLSAEDYAKYLNKISSSIAKSENAIHLNRENGGNTSAPSKLVDGMVAYDKAIVSVNTKLGEYRKKIAAWSAAATGSTQNDYEKLKSQYGDLKTLLDDLKAGTLTAEQFASRFNLIKREASEAADAIAEAGVAFKSGNDAKEYHKQLDKVNDLLVKVKKNLSDWDSAKTGDSSSSYRDLERTSREIESLRNELISTGHALDNFDNRFDEVSSSSKQFATNIKLAGENTKSVKGQVQSLMSTLGISFTFADAFHKVIEIGREMVEVVTEVDVAMTELKKVTDEADSTYVRFLEDAKDRAHGLGATIAETVNATADFARLGHGITDASSLADAALVYKNVGDGIEDISTASESIISAMQAFGIEAKDAMSIIDAYNITGNKFAISSGGVGEALSKSASALAAGNNTLAESIALITSANTTIQNTAVVGTAMKSISMFLRASKTEAEEAGESTEGMANSVSELRDELLALTGQKVDIQLDEDTYKSTYQIISEIAQVWDQLTDINKANILELIGGKRNANVTAALIENFDIAKGVIKEIEASSGSALRENEIYLDSISGRITQLKSSLESLSTSVLNSELVKWVVSLLDGLTQLATVISDVAFDNFFTTLSTLTIGGGAFKLFKDLD